MPTLLTKKAAPQLIDTGHDNCFDLLRLLAAGLVLVAHHWGLSGLPVPTNRLFELFAIGVPLFFAISGYLVAQSWQRDPHLLRFFIRRSLRIFPALWLLVLASALLIGPCLTTLDLASYFAHPQTWRYLGNALLYYQGTLPGVFSHNPYSSTINGSLWTLALEFSCYIAIALVGLASQWLGKPYRYNYLNGSLLLLLYLVCELATYRREWFGLHDDLFWFGSQLRHLPAYARYFLAGALLWQIRTWRGWQPGQALALLLALAGGYWFTHTAGQVLMVWGVATLATTLGNRGLPSHTRFGQSGDFSYGVYIFAFPLSQYLATQQLDFYTSYILVWAGSLLLAAFSWYLVEKPALGYKRWLAATPIAGRTQAPVPPAAPL